MLEKLKPLTSNASLQMLTFSIIILFGVGVVELLKLNKFGLLVTKVGTFFLFGSLCVNFLYYLKGRK